MFEKLIQEYEIRVADKTAHYMETTMIAEFLKKLYAIRKRGEKRIKELEAEKKRTKENIRKLIKKFKRVGWEVQAKNIQEELEGK